MMSDFQKAVKHGVPEDAILIEPEALNSGDNIAKSKALLVSKGMPLPQSIVIVQKPFMLRRAFATTRKVWPDVSISMSGADVSWAEYASKCDIPKETM